MIRWRYENQRVAKSTFQPDRGGKHSGRRVFGRWLDQNIRGFNAGISQLFLNDETEIVARYHDRVGKFRIRETQRRALEQARIFNEAGKLLGECAARQGPQPGPGPAAQHDRENWTRQLGVPYVG